MALFHKMFSFLLYLIIHFSQGQADCRLRESPPSFQNYIAGDDSVLTRISIHRQAIMPGYKFVCDDTTCGNITEWGVDVYPARGQNQMAYSLDFQVWRPSPTVDDSTGTGCYSLVGNNRFTSISLSGGVARVTPSPQDYIQFQRGDVLGFYVEGVRDFGDGVVLTTSGDNSGARSTVWFASIAPSMATSQTGGCPYSVGSNGVLNSSIRGIAPVISIKTETYSCPTTTVASTFTATLEPTPPTTPPGAAGNNNNTNIITITGVNSNIPIPITSEENTDDPVQDSSRGGTTTPILISVIVASASGVVFIMLLVVACATAIVKKQRKKMNGYVINRGAAISNEVYMNRHSAEFDTTYEYVDSPPKPSAKADISVKFNTASEKISTDPPLIQRISTERVAHAHYYDEGPNASQPPELPARTTKVGVQSPEKSANSINSVCHYAETKLANGEQNVYTGDPTLSESFGQSLSSSQADVFDSAGVYVPTVEERATWEGHYVMQESRMYHKLKFFDEDKVYWAPASTTSDLYIQLASKKYREIPRSQIMISSQLGSGQFGEVCKAMWSISGTIKQLAIKTLKPGSKEEEKVKFLQEAAIMGQFCHPNVVRLYGVVTVGDPVMICLELMANGDLRDYLMSMSPRSQNSRTLEIQFLRFSKQIASGMNHLASKSFIHRDLAARNILLDETLTCKVGDFGMARDLMDDTYYTATRGAKIPIKWTAPEALLYKKYSTNSDIWSYGMVLFEIWSVGKKPFSQFTNSEVVRQINTGYNQPPPPGCPRAIYQLMVDCWHPEHYQRPPFSRIIHYLSASKELLLQWVEEADMVSSRAKELGAPLSEAESLYKDLQNAYTSKQ